MLLWKKHHPLNNQIMTAKYMCDTALYSQIRVHPMNQQPRLLTSGETGIALSKSV